MGRSDGEPIAWWVLTPLLATWLALAARRWWVSDGAYVAYQCGRRLARGDGLVFQVDGGSAVPCPDGALWLGLSAALSGAGLDPARWLPALGVACGAALLVLIVDGARRWDLGAGPTAVCGLAWISLPWTSVWATGGLATMAHALVTALAVDRLVWRRSGPVVGAAVGGVLALLRGDGLAWVAVVGVVAAVAPACPRRWATVVAFVGAGIVSTGLAWGMGAPGPTLVGGVSAEVAVALASPWSVAVALAAALALAEARHRRPAAVATLMIGVTLVLAPARTAEAHASGALLPATPFGAWLIGLGTRSAMARWPARAAAVVGVASVVVALTAVPEDLTWWREARSLSRAQVALGHVLRRNLPRGTTVSVGPPGAIGYVSRLPVVDPATVATGDEADVLLARVLGPRDDCAEATRIARGRAGWRGHAPVLRQLRRRTWLLTIERSAQVVADRRAFREDCRELDAEGTSTL